MPTNKINLNKKEKSEDKAKKQLKAEKKMSAENRVSHKSTQKADVKTVSKVKSGISKGKGQQKNKSGGLAAEVDKALKALSEQAVSVKPRQRVKPERRTTTLKIAALGGLGEIGKNLYVYECSNDMFIIDCGMAFPDDDMLGVDIVIPDFTYLENNRDKFRGIVLTHGHEDHIGSLPYLLKKINVPVYGTRLTLGLVEGKLKEHGLLAGASLNVIVPRQTVRLGCMAVEFIRVNHSIPDACAMAVHTPAGVIVHTGDFKVDYTPIEGGIIDLARLGELGNKGVLALLSESTNAERPGYSMSESKVGETFKNLFSSAGDKRIIVATFSSNIHRVQQIIDNAHLYGRKVAVSGRSMLNVLQKAIELNYIKIPKGLIIDIDKINSLPPEDLVVVTTGSQGEPLSALSRMASCEHRQVSINPNDLIIISATPIPGNEKMVGRVVNDLLKLGAEVVYEKMYEVHVSGHACQEELKMMMSLTKPKFFVPIHGEYKHMKKHALLAEKMGIPEENIHILGLGDQLETDSATMKATIKVPAGNVLVDGIGVGDVGSVVLKDRKKLAADGLIIIVASLKRDNFEVLSGPDIVSRGFVYVRESEELLSEAKKIMTEVLKKCISSGVSEHGTIKTKMRDEMSDFIFAKTKRNPMILPVLMEI
ncbi:MAG: ribonuclease J [Eubacterium sp.]|nr:ribonuclease J [Eubacterium sp.]